MIEHWDELNFWSTGEWQVIQERLDDLDKAKINYCPSRVLLFAALDACPYSSVRACIMGQDPYPDPEHATGIAFSIPKSQKKFPPTLKNILAEYQKDLGIDEAPKHGDLSSWVKQGVLLWNAVPSCTAYVPGSHRNWIEWSFLTKEIIQELSNKGIVFGLLGSWAKEYEKYIDLDHNEVIRVAHPSPRAALNTKVARPFEGSRFFTEMNARLKSMHLSTIEWRL